MQGGRRHVSASGTCRVMGVIFSVVAVMGKSNAETRLFVVDYTQTDASKDEDANHFV